MASGGMVADPDRKWSQIQPESIPTASACEAIASISGQVGSRPGPSDALIGRITPTLISPGA
jgi:hypothetical protein